MRRLGLALALALGCGRATIESCESELGGVYVSSTGDRWIVVDERATLEAYPLFPDAPGSGDLVVAPRVIDLQRGGSGAVKRRYTRRADACVSVAPASLVRCADDALEVVLADPPPPLAYAPCRFDRAARHVERWRRE